MSDVKRPRNYYEWDDHTDADEWALEADAYMDHIEAERDTLKAENTRLREALKNCRTSYCGYAITKDVNPLDVLRDFLQELFRIRDIANAALKEDR